MLGVSCSRARCFVLLILLSGLSTAQSQGPYPAFRYQAPALRADLRYLHDRLLHLHPAPYMYCTAEQMEHVFDSLEASIQRPLSELEYLSTIAAVYPVLGDGHTMFLPSSFTAAKGMFAKKLPLDVAVIGERAFVRGNETTDGRLKPGAEVLGINGVPMQAILDTLMRRQVRDGLNTTYPRWILNNWFKEYYRFSFGDTSVFDILLATPNGKERFTVNALPRDSIRANMERNGPVNNRAEQGIVLRFESGDPVAVLTIPTFESATLKSDHGQNAKAELEKAFAAMRERQVKHLILDLRGNQGGDPALGKLLLAHLLDEPFELVHEGPFSGTTRPRKDGFQGKLYVLMNGGCFSATGMVLSCLERHQRAVFIGEEAGGNRTLLSGSPKLFRLPNTHIECYVSSRLWRVADRPNDGHGVMPTILAQPDIHDVISGRDPVLERALNEAR